MALLETKFNDVDVKFGTRTDVCIYCLKELFAQNRGKSRDEFNIVRARMQLEGELENKRIWKHNDTVICQKHMKEIAAEMFPEEMQE